MRMDGLGMDGWRWMDVDEDGWMRMDGWWMGDDGG